MANELSDILKYASQDVLDINSDLVGGKEKVVREKKSKPRKFRNTPTEVDGRKFDSKAEANHYIGLKYLRDVGEIENLKCQPLFHLLPGFTNNVGKKIRGITYKADFRYFDHRDNHWHIVDVKSKPTANSQTFKNKWKMLQYLFKDKKRVLLELVIT